MFKPCGTPKNGPPPRRLKFWRPRRKRGSRRQSAKPIRVAREQAVQLAVEIAARLAGRLDGAAVRAAFLEWLLREIAALPASVRPPGEKLELTSAIPVPAAEAQEMARRIAVTFGGAPDVAFTTDPALIAGLELRSKNFRLQNSWRADLARIRERLMQDDKA